MAEEGDATVAAIGLLVRAFAVKIATLENVETSTVLDAMADTLDDS